MQLIYLLKYYPKAIKLLLAITLISISQSTYSAATDIYVDIYTLTGEFQTSSVYNPTTGNYENQTDLTNPMVKLVYGTLFLKDGFIPSNSANTNANELGINLDTANAISGKPIMKLQLWVSLNNVDSNGNYLSNFHRSTETYMMDGVPYVIVSVKGSNTGGQTNIPGNVCTSTTIAITAGLPVVTLSTPQPNASETGPINGRFQIDLDAPRAQKTSVAFTVSGTATNGKDYAKIKKMVVIPAGTTSAYVDISPINDKKKELDESVTLNINPSSAYTLSTTTVASVNITDND